MGERELRIASRIATDFDPFECDACAAKIIKKFGRASDIRVVRIRTGDGSEGIALAKTKLLISYHRVHVGVRIGETVFDNLHHQGIPLEEWPRRFLTRSGAPLVMEERAVGDFFKERFLRKRFRDWVYGD